MLPKFPPRGVSPAPIASAATVAASQIASQSSANNTVFVVAGKAVVQPFRLDFLNVIPTLVLNRARCARTAFLLLRARREPNPSPVLLYSFLMHAVV